MAEKRGKSRAHIPIASIWGVCAEDALPCVRLEAVLEHAASDSRNVVEHPPIEFVEEDDARITVSIERRKRYLGTAVSRLFRYAVDALKRDDDVGLGERGIAHRGVFYRVGYPDKTVKRIFRIGKSG